MEQCLSEHDRGILLQEIQQIQRTLEESGRSFPAAEADNHGSSDEEEEGYDLYKCKQEIQSDDAADKDELSEDESTAFSHSGSVNPTFEKELGAIVNDPLAGNSEEFLGDLSSNAGFDEVNTNNDDTAAAGSPKETAEDMSEGTLPKSSVSFKSRKRIKKESNGGSKVRTISKKSRDKNGSSRNSIESSSLPTKQIEKINMANLYVERLFGAFRNKKTNPPNLCTVDEGRYGISELKSSANLSSLENLLQVNRRYKDLLEDELKKVELALARNARAQDEVNVASDDKNVLQNATFSGLSKACIGRFGNPYFKDNEGMGPPDNDDTTDKKRRIKVDPFIRGAKPWKSTEVAALEEGVYHNNLEKRLEDCMKKLKHFDKDCKEKQKKGIQTDKTPRFEISNEIANIKQLPRQEIIVDPTEIDFFRISKNFLPTRDEFECRLQWCNVAHPLINQTPFTKDEDATILKLASKYNNCGWEQIAKEIGTHRTPIQCLQRFQRTLNKEILKTTWDVEDDNKLREAVSMFGSHNWVNVADFLGDRTGDQCMHRWQKTLDPNIKRGKWSEEEDQILLKAVEKYGTKNWKELKKEVPGRTDAQCRERYVSTLDPTKNWGAFTEEEDEKIIDLVRKHGVGKWSLIAKEFPSRRDNQIWRRYTQIESENYHKYRRGVIWKRKSVLNYFFHRQSERRDYGLDELDINPTPSLTHMESRKLERTREELEKCGYTNEEIIKKLARMHYEGHFAKSMYKSRQRPYSQGRGQKTGGRVQTPSKFASKELLADLQNVLLSVKDPSTELPAPPAEPLKRKTRIERDVDIEGYKRIKRPVQKQKVRKVTWLAQEVDIDTFRQKCEKIIMKLVSKDLCYEEARTTLDQYYEGVQQPNNKDFNKRILQIYTGVLIRYLNMIDENENFKQMMLVQDEIPLSIMKLEHVHSETSPRKIHSKKISPRKNVKRGAKNAAFKKMVKSASRVTDSFSDECSNSDDDIGTSVVEFPHHSVGKDSSLNPIKTGGNKLKGSPGKVVSAQPSSQSKQYKDSKTIFLQGNMPHTGSGSSIATSDDIYGPKKSANVKLGPDSIRQSLSETHMTIMPVKLEANAYTTGTSSDTIVNESSINRNNVSHESVTDGLYNNQDRSDSNDENYSQGDCTTTSSKRRLDSPRNAAEPSTLIPSRHEQAKSSQLQVPGENSNDATDRATQLNNDKVNTFQLLLQALWIDTPGVMGTISGTSAPNPTGMLSSVPFPTCYPLSPNSASLLGFRKLLLHRRKLGEIVREHAENSERIGIPVLRDKSYQNTKAYDALRKRFRSIFTWPAFLATFIPKYTEEKKSRTSKSNKSTPRSQTIKFNEPQSTCSSISTPTSTSTKRYIDNTCSSSHSAQFQQNNSLLTSPRASISEITESQPVDDIASRYTVQRIHEEQLRSGKRLYKRKGVLPVTITSPLKKKCIQQSMGHQHGVSQEAIACKDKGVDAKRTSKSIHKRKLYTDGHSSCGTTPITHRTGMKMDERENNGDKIFIPPSVKLEVTEEDVCTEIVTERDSSQVLT